MNRMATLSPFQKEKLEYYFKFFDGNDDGIIEYDDLAGFTQKILDYTKWSPQSSVANELFGVHEAFFEILMEKTSHEVDKKVTLDDWFVLWANLVHGSMGMQDFPVWLRLLPRSLFRIIDRDEDGFISEQELAHFYEHFVHIEKNEAKRVSKLAYENMTDFGRYPLNLASYEQVFANFLLGKTPYGPGRFIFGCFEHNIQVTKFRLIQDAPDEELPVEPKPNLQRRQSADGAIKLRLKKV